MDAYQPTDEQKAIITHDGHAFVRACPGAGKTRTLVERARQLFADTKDLRGVAFLSFTNAAVDELGTRMARFGVLPAPIFPNFIGTFDRFLWQFLIAPFGIEGSGQTPRLVPDKRDWEIKPYEQAQPLTLAHFDRRTGTIIPEKAAEIRFTPRAGPKAWETTAKRVIDRSFAEGQLDFEDVRACVRQRLEDKSFAARVGAAVAGRFREIVVDEAQDCNPADLEIIDWLRASGMTIKVICDPNQAIYGFRGGLTDQLQTFASTFAQHDQLPMSGNFRSSPAICAAISQLRPPSLRGTPDMPIGRFNGESEPVHLLSYGGTSVPATIGANFLTLITRLGIPSESAPVLASTWASASNAAGRKVVDAGEDRTMILAEAVMAFSFAFEAGNRREALRRLHRIVLLVRGHIPNKGSYSTHLATLEDEGRAWREEIIAIGQALRVLPGETDEMWLGRAKTMIDRNLLGTASINQRLRRNRRLAEILAVTDATGLPARAIHSVKGLEFPAVCVVLTPKSAGGIVGALSGTTTLPEIMEEARKIYVAASRAMRLLAIAVPKSRVANLKALFEAGGANTSVVML